MSTQSLNTNKPCIYLLLGSNLGKRKYQLDKAKALIQSLIGDIISESSIYETQPWGNLDQKSFLNQAVGIKSQLTPDQMLDKIHDIEKEMGRTRKEKNEPRIIDIDILLWKKNDDPKYRFGNSSSQIAFAKFCLSPFDGNSRKSNASEVS